MSDVGRHEGRKSTRGEVQVLDALPSALIAFDVTLFTSFLIQKPARGLPPTKIFSSAAPYAGFARDFSLQPKHNIYPVRFRAGNQLRVKLGALADLLGDGQVPPFSLNLPTLRQPIRVNPFVDKFGDGLVVSGIRYSGSTVAESLEDTLTSAADIVRVVTRSADKQLLKALASYVAGTSADQLSTLQKHRVHASFRVSTGSADIAADMARLLASHRREIVALHITGDPRKLPDSRLEQALLSENAELNLKSESQLLLVNAQGSTLISADLPREGKGNRYVERGSIYFNRHERVVDLGEIAAAMQHLLLQARSHAELDASSWSGDSDVIERWIRYPSNVLFASVSHQKAWRAFSSAYSLSELFAETIHFDGKKLGEPSASRDEGN